MILTESVPIQYTGSSGAVVGKPARIAVEIAVAAGDEKTSTHCVSTVNERG